MAFDLDVSNRLKKLPPDRFVEIDREKARAKSQGISVIDFGVGDPDKASPDFVIEAMKTALDDEKNHHYPLDRGDAAFREAVANWCQKRFQCRFDPATEILPLIGSKEGIAHLPLAFINPGDIALMTDPGYPAYRSGVLFAGGTVYSAPIKEENAYLPELKKIPAKVLKKAKLFFVNYPNNPTGAVASRVFYAKLVSWAKKHHILIVSDMAYSEIYFGKEKPLSIFEIPGAKEVAIEFHSLSKTSHMTGWRIGFALGKSQFVDPLLKVKSNLDSGVFTAIQKTAITALENSFSFTPEINKMYRSRRDILVSGLRELGFPIQPNPATFYVFTRMPKGEKNSRKFCEKLLSQTGIVATPGIGFGPSGEGYVRFTLTVPEPKIHEALARMKRLF